MSSPVFQRNRERFSKEELRQYERKWVAFSADGCRVVASADDISSLHAALVQSGVGPEDVKLERVVLEDDWQGEGTELE